MTVSPTQFRSDFSAFSDTVKYPDATVQFWLNLGYKLLRSDRWVDMLDTGVELYAAHNLVLEAQANASAAAGSPPGQMTGPVNNKSVGPASIGFDTTSAAEEGKGNWNLTTYGSRFAQLVNIVGAGPVQVSC